ncbi:MAG: amidase, partial [Alphaproteobacteria bacterium]|nr:amidase [Alphaproteobacteria bacterium]
MTSAADLSATEALQRLRSGDLTSRALIEACIARIEACEAEIQAWQYFDADLARAQADACDAARAAGKPLGGLHGLPVGIKDIIDTGDMPTESGTPHFKGRQPEADARVVSKLREAGAVIMGKTVTTELAALAPSKS